MEETGVLVPGEKHRPAASQAQTLSHNVVLNTPHYELRHYTCNMWDLFIICIFLMTFEVNLMFEYPGPAGCDHVLLHFVSCIKCFRQL